MVILGPFWDHFGLICGPELKIVADYSCDHSKRPQEEQNINGNGTKCGKGMSLWAGPFSRSPDGDKNKQNPVCFYFDS